MDVKNSLYQNKTKQNPQTSQHFHNSPSFPHDFTPAPSSSRGQDAQGWTNWERKSAPVIPPRCHCPWDFQAQETSATPKFKVTGNSLRSSNKRTILQQWMKWKAIVYLPLPNKGAARTTWRDRKLLGNIRPGQWHRSYRTGLPLSPPLSPTLGRTLWAFIVRGTLRILLFKGPHSFLTLNSFPWKEVTLTSPSPALHSDKT